MPTVLGSKNVRAQTWTIVSSILLVILFCIFLSFKSKRDTADYDPNYIYKDFKIAKRTLLDNPHDIKSLRTMIIYHSVRKEYGVEMTYLSKMASERSGDRAYKYIFALRLIEDGTRDGVAKGLSLLKDLSNGSDKVAEVAKLRLSQFDSLTQNALERGKSINKPPY